VVRVTLTVVAIGFCLYLVYLLRRPITWLFIALFIAVALAPLVNRLSNYMRRGLAIGLAYLALFGTIVLLTALIVPPIVSEATDLADNAPQYVEDVREYVEKNRRLNEINQDYQITDKLEEEAAELRAELPAADPAGLADEVGDLFFVLANLARKLDLDPEECLRAANAKFERRFTGVEQRLAARGLSPADAGLEAMEAEWQAVKAAEASGG